MKKIKNNLSDEPNNKKKPVWLIIVGVVSGLLLVLSVVTILSTMFLGDEIIGNINLTVVSWILLVLSVVTILFAMFFRKGNDGDN